MAALSVAGWFVGPNMTKIINLCYDYIKDQGRWQTGMKKELESLRENKPKIESFVFEANQAQISDQNHPINKWIWQLRDALDEVNDVLDEFEYLKLEKQLTEKQGSILNSINKRAVEIFKRGVKIDPNLKRLEDAVQKLEKVSANFSNLLHLLDSAKKEQQEQQRVLSEARETGSLPTNDLIDREVDMEYVKQWLRRPSNMHRTTRYKILSHLSIMGPLQCLRSPSNEPRTTRYGNISLLSIVGHGGVGKTTLLQHVYEIFNKHEMRKEFDLKMWVSVSKNFDVKKVIADMLESIKKKRPSSKTLEKLQRSLENEVMSQRFLLVLDDVWEDEEEQDKSKWGNVLAPLASGGFGSKILVTTRADSVALMFAKVIKKEKEIYSLKGMEDDQCLELLISHAFSVVENRNDYHNNLIGIAREKKQKLLGSPLLAKVIGNDLFRNLDESHWRRVLENNFFGHNYIYSILGLSYIFLPNHLQNCLAFCCKFPKGHTFKRDDLLRMWIALGFIQPSQGMTMEDTGVSHFDVLVNKTLFYKDQGDDDYKIHGLIRGSASKFFAHECVEVLDDNQVSLEISETIRHLSVQNANPDILRKIEEFKHLHSLFLYHTTPDEDICSALTKIFEALRNLRLLYVFAPGLESISEHIKRLMHLRYLKIDGHNLTRLPSSLNNLYHMQYILCDSQGVPSPTRLNFLISCINEDNLPNLRMMHIS